MSEIGVFYKAEDRATATHLALRLNGRVRYTVPRDQGSQEACWTIFRPGRLEIPLRAMARLPRLFRAVSCVEAENLKAIRDLLALKSGLSCSRTGAKGVWSKDTILFLRSKSEPLCLVKVGTGNAVDALVKNEADWLQRLGSEGALAENVPRIIAHQSGAGMCFVAQSVLFGDLDFSLGVPQFEFLKGLQACSRQSKQYADSSLCRTLDARFNDLNGCLTEAWSNRLQKALLRIKESLSESAVPLVAAHNDFAPWNIRIRRNVASVFDWEYAANEQFPLFDPLHFALMPLALKGASPGKLIQTMKRTLHLCNQWLGEERCQHAEIQALAYFVNLASLFLWADRGGCTQHPVIVRYAYLIDSLCGS